MCQPFTRCHSTCMPSTMCQTLCNTMSTACQPGTPRPRAASPQILDSLFKVVAVTGCRRAGRGPKTAHYSLRIPRALPCHASLRQLSRRRSFTPTVSPPPLRRRCMSMTGTSRQAPLDASQVGTRVSLLSSSRKSPRSSHRMSRKHSLHARGPQQSTWPAGRQRSMPRVGAGGARVHSVLQGAPGTR